MNIKIENYKNLKKLDYTIDDNKINFLFGMSGSGKSSILSAVSSDNPNNSKMFGSLSSDSLIIEVDGTIVSPTDTHVFDINKMNFLLEQSDIEHFKEVILLNNNEHNTIHNKLENKISKLSNSINSEMPTFERYSAFLEDLKAKKLTKNNKIPNTSPFAKVMTKIKTLNKSKIFNEIVAMDNKLFDWQMKGIPFINNQFCPFCEKKLSTKRINKLNKMSGFDSKSIGTIKEGINNNASQFGLSATYNYNEMKNVEKLIIKYSLAVKSFEEIVKQFHDAFEESFDYTTISKICVTRFFKELFPLTAAEYNNVFKNVRSLKSSIKTTQEATDKFLKGKKKIINDIFEQMNIPYEFTVQYHRDGPNEYSIIHKNDSNRKDDKQCMSDGEKAIVSLVLFLASARATNYKIYFIDDPVSSFDIYRRKLIYDLIIKCLKGKTVIVLSHDPVFAKFAISNKASKNIGTISYLSNNGKNEAIIQSVKNVAIESFAKSVVERCHFASNQYERSILARLLLEEHFGQGSVSYTYLSKILHGVSYSDIQSWLIGKGKNEADVVKAINRELQAIGLPANYLAFLSSTYNIDIDISNYSIYEKCIVMREIAKKNNGRYSQGVVSELNNSVHLNDALAIGINVFEFPLISRTLLDEVNKLPNRISI